MRRIEVVLLDRFQLIKESLFGVDRKSDAEEFGSFDFEAGLSA